MDSGLAPHLSLYQRTRALASELDFHPSKRLGQSFLVDANLAGRIAALARPETGDWLLEIGPGFGALTTELVQLGPSVVAIERDRRLASVLARDFRGRVNFGLTNMDATRLDWARIARRPPVLVSNLPYPITSEILLELAQSPSPVRRAVLMLQREVVDRLTAAASTSERSSLSVLVQLSFRVRRELNAPPEVFWPRPDVHSAVISLEPHAHPPAQSESLRHLLREGFGQRRKTLANSLGIGRRRPADLLQRAGLPDRIRAQDLTNEQWLVLASLERRAGS